MTSIRIAAAAFFFLACAATTAGPARVRVGGEPVRVKVALAANAAGRLLLHLDDVRFAGGESVALRVLANGVLVEELYLVPSRQSGHSSPQNFVLPLPDEVKAPITVSLVPLKRVSLSMKRPYVTVER